MDGVVCVCRNLSYYFSSDGAGAVLLMKRSLAVQKGLPILGVFRTFVDVGVPPTIMGIGLAVAIPAAVKAAGLQLEDIDLFEINEAFASQYLYCQKKLELDPQKINVNGGAMAIGHPLGVTGGIVSRENPRSTSVPLVGKGSVSNTTSKTTERSLCQNRDSFPNSGDTGNYIYF